MAKGRRDELFDRLRASGLRKRVAKAVADDVARVRSGKTPRTLDRAVSDLRALASELEDRARGGPAQRKAAAQKAARTRQRNAAKRSSAAKKAAQTRASRSSGSSGGRTRRASSSRSS